METFNRLNHHLVAEDGDNKGILQSQFQQLHRLRKDHVFFPLATVGRTHGAQDVGTDQQADQNPIF